VSYSNLILKDRPDIIWAFDDIDDSASISRPINFFNTSSVAYSASINTSATSVIKVPIIYGGRTVLSLESSSVVGISIPAMNRFSELYKSKEYALEFWIQANSVVPQEITIVKRKNSTNVGLFLKENYLIYRYGNSSSFTEVSYGLAELENPTHIVMNYNNGNISLIVNGVVKSESVSENQQLPVDASHDSNNILEFYGHEQIKIFVDSAAIYPYALSTNMAKKHYFYGLGKNFNENLFFNLGGDYYNFSTNNTKKNYFDYWELPQEWRLSQRVNLSHDNSGLYNIQYAAPVLYSSDNNITASNNSIKFSTASISSGTAIDIFNLSSIMRDKSEPFFVKVRIDGQLPSSGSSQTIMSYGLNPISDIIQFKIENSSGSYYLKVVDAQTASSLSFYIPSATSSPTAYIGMKYDPYSIFYFSLSGSSVQSASFANYSGSVYGSDPFSSYFPPTTDNVVRIGSNFTFDQSTASPSDVNQFSGTFLKFLVASSGFSASSYNDIDSYTKEIYSATYDTSLSRFKVSSYGTMNFIIHGARLAETSDSGSVVISSNRFEFGYPDVISGSQVNIYATLYDYSGSVSWPKTKLSKINSLEWLNLKDLNRNYTSFDIEIKGEDILAYRPTVKYFKGEAYNYSGSYTDIVDFGGTKIRLHSNASAQSYIPEFDETPSIFLTDYSGIKFNNSIGDIKFRPTKLGVIGFYIKFNDSASATRFLEIFSSSSLSTSLFSASVDSSNNIVMSSSSAKYYLNGASAQTIYDKNWAHVAFAFDPKLDTASVNEFVVRFGNQSKSNFNIQNVYMLETLLGDIEISYINNSFIGGSAVVLGGHTASYSINLVDSDESKNYSQDSEVIYQAYDDQNKILSSVIAATSNSASNFTTNELVGDDSYFDLVKVRQGDRILSLLDNEVYEVNASAKLVVVPTVNNDYVNVLSGQSYKNKAFVKLQGVFTETKLIPKIVTYLVKNTQQ
jgi:hypothetical protein